MATPVAPKYGAGPTTLPHPGIEGCQETVNVRGASRGMADGTMSTDLVASGLKRTFTLIYTNVTTTQKNAINTFLSTLGGGSITFYPPQESGGSTSYTVTRDESLTPVVWSYARAGDGSFLWSTSFTLREE